jgi:hypothetical protein
MRTLRFRANAWDDNLKELGYLEATSFAEGEEPELRETAWVSDSADPAEPRADFWPGVF